MQNLIPNFIAEKYNKKEYKGSFDAFSLFIDISGFTNMTQTLMKNGKEGAEILSEIINSIFTKAINIVYGYGGFISVFAGDAFTAIFQENNDKALQCALSLQQLFIECGRIKTKFAEFHLQIKIGLDFGNVEWGIIGLEKKLMNYYFRGPAIDGCAKAEHYAEKGDIIISTAALEKLKENYNLEFLEFEKRDKFFLCKNKNNLKFKYEFDIKKGKISKKILEIFYPAELVNNYLIGEFRNVVAIFISFLNNEILEKSLLEILEKVSTYGAYLNSLDFGDKGAYLLIFFGVPQIRENYVKHALDFALSLQLNGIRIGISEGIVYWGRVGSDLRAIYTCLGETVNLAARLTMRAAFGEILISQSVYQMAKENYVFIDKGKELFKGFQDKLNFYQLLSSKKQDERLLFTSKCIGRSKEIEEVESLLYNLYEKKGVFIIVDGIPGIGKSRLIWEIKERNKNFTWFYFPCDEVISQPFNPIVYFLKNYFDYNLKNEQTENIYNFYSKLEKLKSHLKNLQADDIISDLDDSYIWLADILNLPIENSLLKEIKEERRRDNQLFAVLTLILAECKLNPVVIQLEDYQWLDPLSIKFFNIILRQIKDLPLALVITSRLDDKGSTIHWLSKEPDKRIFLKNLNAIHTEEFCSNYLNTEHLPRKTLNQIYKLTQGNPFYLEQFLIYLKEENLLDDNFRLSKSIEELPQSVNVLIIARIDRLSYQLKEAIKVASVLGVEFAIEILTEILKNFSFDLPENIYRQGEVEQIWNNINQMKLIFKHAVIQQAVYQMQLKTTLAKLHNLVGKILEMYYGDNIEHAVHELAHHYYCAYELSNSEEDKENLKESVKRHLINALEKAEINCQREEMDKIINRLLNLETEENKIIEYLFKKANNKNYLGEYSEAEKIYNELMNNYKNNNDVYYKAKMLLGILKIRTGEFNEVKALLEECKDYYQKKKDIETTLDIFYHLSNVYFNLGEPDKGKNTLKQILKIARRKNYWKLIVKIIFKLRNFYLKKGIFIKLLQKYLKIAETNDDKFMQAQILFYLNDAYICISDPEKALEYNLRFQKMARLIGDRLPLCYAIGDLGIIYGQLMDYPKAISCFKEKIKIANELGDLYNKFEGWKNLGTTYLMLDNYSEAEKCFLKVNEIFSENVLAEPLLINYNDLIDLYLTTKNYQKAEEFIKLSEEAIQKYKYYNFQNEIDLAKIRLLAQDNVEKTIELLEKKALSEKDLVNKAKLFYHIYELKPIKEYAKKALSLNERLLKKTNNHLYKYRVNKIVSNLKNMGG